MSEAELVEIEAEKIRKEQEYSDTHKMLAEQNLRWNLRPALEGIPLEVIAQHLGLCRITRKHLDQAGVKLRVCYMRGAQPVYHHASPEDVKAILISRRAEQGERADRAAAALLDLDDCPDVFRTRTKSSDSSPQGTTPREAQRKPERP